MSNQGSEQPARTETSPGAPTPDSTAVRSASRDNSAGGTGPVTSRARLALEHQQRVDQEELTSDTLRLRWLSIVGAIAWAVFALQDWMVVHFVGSSSLDWFWTIRAGGLLPIGYVVYRLHRRKPLTRAGITYLDIGIFTLVQTGIALMCVRYEGIASRYVTGIMVALIARSSVLAAPWKRGLTVMGIPLLTFPLVMVGAAFFRPDIRAQFANTDSLSIFLQNIFVLVASLGVCVWGGHGNWALRRQLFEARSIGKYRLKERIGRGGMGEVWVAYHTGLRRDVALKILRTDQDANPVSVRRFEQEVSATSLLTHPNTVRVFDYGVTEDGIRFYAMELLSGQTLYELVWHQGPLETSRVLHIGRQIARALAEAHARGIVHRDIKPENVFVTRAGDEPDFVKVLDFGIAKLTQDTDEGTLTRTGAIFGTPAYMSPEATNGRTVDARSDVYSLGCVLYFMLAGHPPFAESSPAEVLFAHAHREPPSLRIGRRTRLPANLEQVVMRCLNKAPEDRYSNASELVRALSAVDIGSNARESTHPIEMEQDSESTALAPTTRRA